jgi:hypothetical protein
VAGFIRPGQKGLRRNGIDGGKGKGNLAGDWAPGREEPVWVFSNLEPEKALEIYRSRMKMEPSFRDLKGLLGLEKVMSKKLERLIPSNDRRLGVYYAEERRSEGEGEAWNVKLCGRFFSHVGRIAWNT